MKLSKKIIAIPAIALAAGLSLAACGSSGSSNSGSGPALTAGSATASQICSAVPGMKVINTLTGQDTGTTVSSSTPEPYWQALPDGKGPNASGNEVAGCTLTLDTGTELPATVTLFADGHIGFAEQEVSHCPYTNCNLGEIMTTYPKPTMAHAINNS